MSMIPVAQMNDEWNYLSSPWREVLERPPNFAVIGRLLDLLADFHGGVLWSSEKRW
jgi:hypothetical protein